MSLSVSRGHCMAKKRIHKEWADLQKEELGAMSLAPKGDDMFNWEAKLPGPEGSVYDGGLFAVDIQLPTDYPFSPPKATFKTRIYHMNIADSGAICIDILKTNWSPALSLLKVLLSLSSLLTDPNPKDPLVPTIANQYTRSRKKHDETAREWTRLYAMPKDHLPPPPPPVQKKAPTRSGPRGARARQPAAAPAPAASSSRIIEIDDDDEVQVVSTTAPRRSAAVAGRRRTRAETALETDAPEDDANTSAAGRKRRRPNASSNGTSMSSDDVIVID
ncbi:hypothetical protein AURDEDRAFT_181473 [Auricularia subglabra TFB-10046 SS5]|nr:hypothetical protein AURDEDRAFT_181473 [Auricularia subglabra TFB-10046 SS5]